MEFYISPDQKKNVEHKINIMFKHLATQPNVTYGNVEKIIRTTIYDYGYEGHEKRSQKISAIKVEIEDIKAGDWTLVATVQYKTGRILMWDARYYKYIPEKFGLEYTKCDHCGATHKNRTESHILFNQKTSEWMQVGSTCINKMVNTGKYLNGLMIKLYNVINCYGGCDSDGWSGGWWRPSYKYIHDGIRIEEAMAFCLAFMDKNGKVWVKPEWDYGYKVKEGTNDALIRYVNDSESSSRRDEELFENIRTYFSHMERGVDDPYNGPSFNQKLIDAFTNDFITIGEMYLAWFAITNYENTITSGDFKTKIENAGFTKGTTVNITAELKNINRYETYDWRGQDIWGYDAVFEDKNTGFIFIKSISYPNVIEKYKSEDGLYRFEGDIKWISYQKQTITLGGRLRKQKPTKK